MGAGESSFVLRRVGEAAAGDSVITRATLLLTPLLLVVVVVVLFCVACRSKEVEAEFAFSV